MIVNPLLMEHGLFSIGKIWFVIISRKDLLLNISLLLLYHSKRCYKMIQSLYHECKIFVNEKYFSHAKINE